MRVLLDLHADGRVQVPAEGLEQVPRRLFVPRPRHRQELRRGGYVSE